MKGSLLHRAVKCALTTLPMFLLSSVPAWAVEEQAQTKVTAPVLDLARTTSLAMTIMKVFGSLVLTVGLMLLLAACFKKLGMNRAGTRQGALISILDTKMIAPKKYVAVVQVAEETLAIGITDQHISLLTRLEKNTAQVRENFPDKTLQKSFATLLGKRMKRD